MMEQKQPGRSQTITGRNATIIGQPAVGRRAAHRYATNTSDALRAPACPRANRVMTSSHAASQAVYASPLWTAICFRGTAREPAARARHRPHARPPARPRRLGPAGQASVRLWRSSSPPPIALTPDDAAAGDHNHFLVQLEGKLLRLETTADGTRLQLQGDHQFFSAVLPASLLLATSGATACARSPNSILRLTLRNPATRIRAATQILGVSVSTIKNQLNTLFVKTRGHGPHLGRHHRPPARHRSHGT